MVEDVHDAAVKGELAAEHVEAKAQEDVGQLRDGGEGQQALHVLLRQVHQEAEEHRHDGADDDDPANGLGDDAGAGKGTCQDRDADLDHRGAVQVGRHGRGGLHGAGQPHVERQLRGLGPRGNDDADQDRGLPTAVEAGQGRDLERAGLGKEQAHGHVQAQGADVREDEGLHGRLLRSGGVVVTDERPGAGTRDLEEHELGDEGVAVDQARHGADEHGEERVEAAARRVGVLAVACVHVPDGVDGDEQADADEGRGEHDAHLVEDEADHEGVADSGDVEGLRSPSVNAQADPSKQGASRGDGSRKDANPLGHALRAHRDDERAHKRHERGGEAQHGKSR